ncbi:hypothetical protein C7S14_0418 [Burkholderia cepacia]|nr:hypothetical protein C7S14_0418 [Burkholderia cepacia]
MRNFVFPFETTPPHAQHPSPDPHAASRSANNSFPTYTLALLDITQ